MTHLLGALLACQDTYLLVENVSKLVIVVAIRMNFISQVVDVLLAL